MAAIGWREWLTLPDLNITGVKAKTDTGARTSALHATEIEAYERDGHAQVRFCVRPNRNDRAQTVVCEAPLVDMRRVTNSGGSAEQRCVIRTLVVLGDFRWSIEVTLTDRGDMIFPMLLGRTALAGRFLVDPSRSYVFGRRHRSPS